MPRNTVAANAGDTLGVVPAAFESVDLGGEGVVGLDEGGEMVVEDKAQDIRPPRDIGGGVCGRDC